MSSTTMPVFFLAHGNPISVIQHNHFTNDWHALHDGTPTPTAMVFFSAHWETRGTRVLNSAKPRTIHDFGGFPQEMYDIQYPSPGQPELAQNLVDTLNHSGFAASTDDSWGLDHGTWVILKHLYPDADIPVLQISLDTPNTDLSYHYRLAQSLRPFRDQGVLFVGSGNIVHNIRKWLTAGPNDSTDWAVDFDNAIAEAIRENDLDTLFHYEKLPDARVAVPSVEHYLPLIYVMGLANEEDRLQFSEFPFQDLGTACSRSVKFY